MDAEERDRLCHAALDAMAEGASLNGFAKEIGVDVAKLWRLIHASEEMVRLYDCIQERRSRVMIENAIYAIQTNPDNARAKIDGFFYLKLAGLLNPRMYSDKVHGSLKQGGLSGGQRVSFVLNIGSGQTQEHKGELTAIPQPEDGDLP